MLWSKFCQRFQNLKSEGFKTRDTSHSSMNQFQISSIPINPSVNSKIKKDWQTNAVVFALIMFGRHKAQQIKGPTILWSICGVSIPYFAFQSTSRLDSRRERLGHRRTLDEMLDYHPITRRAWEKAVSVNTNYQRELKAEIIDLEEKIAKKKLALS